MEHTSNSISKVSSYALAATVFLICSTLTFVCGSNATNSSSTYSLIYEFMAVSDFVWTAYGNYTPKVLCKVDAVLTECTKGRFNFSRYTGPYYQRNIFTLSAQLSGNIGETGEEMMITDPEHNTWREMLVAIADGQVCAVFVTMYRPSGQLPSAGLQQLGSGTTNGRNRLTTTTGPLPSTGHKHLGTTNGRHGLTTTTGPLAQDEKCYNRTYNIGTEKILCELRVQGIARANRPKQCDELYKKHCLVSKCQIDDPTCPDQDLPKQRRKNTSCPIM